MDSEKNNSISVKAFFLSQTNGMSLEDWLSWPPDVFAFTSLLLKRTGVYVYTVLPPKDTKWPEDEDWQKKLNSVKHEWQQWILGEENLPEFILENKLRLENNWQEITIDELRQWNTEKSPNPRVWELCRAILELHALADETCAGFGLPIGNIWGNKTYQIILQSVANILLAHTGSLARFPTHIVKVLPKLRTPGTGLTLRSLSNNLSVHETEVEINWRTIPWVNIDENTINILIVPWPFKIDPIWFRQSSYSTQRNSFEPTRYFEYSNQGSEFLPTKLLELLENAERSVGRVHMIVFPELALTKANFQELLNAVANSKKRDQLPMILAGINLEREEEGSKSGNEGLGKNIIVLSTFFAGKWYKMEQHKHHRWKLDGKQIKQYNLGGVLAANRDWWEAIKIHKRYLSVLAPNSWLSLCHLVCEDLARLEPVSEIIRGVGPTLLVALLLDGPQLKDRWSGRYASVLADDPGSSVLTVSSLGFTSRSLDPDGNDGSRIIALWKDQITGWKEIEIEKEKEGVVLTVSANWTQEFTSDGRGDGNTASVFALQGVHQVEASAIDTQEREFSEYTFKESERYDLLEISLFSYFVDAILDTPSDIVRAMRGWILGEKKSAGLEKLRPRRGLFAKIASGTEKWLQDDSTNENFRPFVDWLCALIQKIPDGDKNVQNPLDYYQRIVNLVAKILEKVMETSFITELDQGNPFDNLANDFEISIPEPPHIERKSRRVRICIYGSLAILWGVHSRLNDQRRIGKLNRDGTILLSQIEELLGKNYDKQWYEAIQLDEKSEIKDQS